MDRSFGFGLSGSAGNCLNQPQCIVILRVVKDLVGSTVFHDTTILQDIDVVGIITNQSQIVGNEQHCHVEFVLDILNQTQDLSLNRHVQRCSGLIGDEQSRMTG